MLKILGRLTSINVRKVVWAADEMGLVYTREDWGMPIRDPNAPEFLALNPNGLVPVLIEDDFVLWESNPIMRYLAERTGSELLPKTARDRALVDQWCAWQAVELSPAIRYVFLAFGRPTPGYDDPRQIEGSIAATTKKMRILEGRLADGWRYLVGDAFTLADIAVGVGVHRWFATPFERPELPRVSAYYDRLRERSAGAPYLGPTTP